MTSHQQVQEREIQRWECPVHVTAWAPALQADETPLCGRRGCGKPLALVSYVPREVAERLADALKQAEAVLWRAQTYIGLLRQYDEGLPAEVARTREQANQALADPSIPNPESVMPAPGASVSHRLSDPKAGEAFDARAAGRRVVEKHGDALRRLSDEAEEA